MRNGQESNVQYQQAPQSYFDQDEEQVYNTGYFNAADEQEHRNARVYYLDPEELLKTLWKYLTGRKTVNGTRDEALALMPDKAAVHIVNELRVPVDKVSRLSNLKPEEINERVWRHREGIAGWLVVEGWLKYNISIDHFELIMNQVETLLLTAFKWAQNDGGRYFLTTSNRSVETQSHVLNQPGGGSVLNKRSAMNPFKPM